MPLSKKEVKERNFSEWGMGFVDLDLMATKLPGFMKLLETKPNFLDLHGDSALVTKLIDGFHEGRWRQSLV
jgi:hypothetical protein